MFIMLCLLSYHDVLGPPNQLSFIQNTAANAGATSQVIHRRTIQKRAQMDNSERAIEASAWLLD